MLEKKKNLSQTSKGIYIKMWQAPIWYQGYIISLILQIY